MKTRRIHHFEDEPDTMSWVPDALLNYYWAECPGWIEGDASYQVDPEGRFVRFILNPKPGAPVVIEYRVYATRGEFDAYFYQLVQGEDVLLLDVMTIDPASGKTNPSGLDLMKKGAGEAEPGVDLLRDRLSAPNSS